MTTETTSTVEGELATTMWVDGGYFMDSVLVVSGLVLVGVLGASVVFGDGESL